MIEPQSPQSEAAGADTIVPAVVLPVIGVGAIILGVSLGLRWNKQNMNKNNQIDNPMSLLSRTDKINSIWSPLLKMGIDFYYKNR